MISWVEIVTRSHHFFWIGVLTVEVHDQCRSILFSSRCRCWHTLLLASDSVWLWPHYNGLQLLFTCLWCPQPRSTLYLARFHNRKVSMLPLNLLGTNQKAKDGCPWFIEGGIGATRIGLQATWSTPLASALKFTSKECTKRSSKAFGGVHGLSHIRFQQ